LVIKGPERKDIVEAAVLLRKTKKDIFRRLAQLLLRSRRSRISINVGKLAKMSKPGTVVVVPGKVLGDGTIKHIVDVVALSFSQSALQKIKAAGGEIHDFAWLVEHGTKDVMILK